MSTANGKLDAAQKKAIKRAMKKSSEGEALIRASRSYTQEALVIRAVLKENHLLTNAKVRDAAKALNDAMAEWSETLRAEGMDSMQAGREQQIELGIR